MSEAGHLMHLSDARQTLPLPANAPLPHRSVFPPDLDLQRDLDEAACAAIRLAPTGERPAAGHNLANREPGGSGACVGRQCHS
jgi:hypothetical protein